MLHIIYNQFKDFKLQLIFIRHLVFNMYKLALINLIYLISKILFHCGNHILLYNINHLFLIFMIIMVTNLNLKYNDVIINLLHIIIHHSNLFQQIYMQSLYNLYQIFRSFLNLPWLQYQYILHYYLLMVYIQQLLLLNLFQCILNLCLLSFFKL